MPWYMTIFVGTDSVQVALSLSAVNILWSAVFLTSRHILCRGLAACKSLMCLLLYVCHAFKTASLYLNGRFTFVVYSQCECDHDSVVV